VPYLRVANVQRGYLNLAEVKTIEATETEIRDLRLQRGDVLLNEGGDRDKLGRGWIWNDELRECIHQNHVFRVRPDRTRIEPKYLSYYTNTHGQRYFLEQGKQTTNLASINLTKLGALPIPVPPLELQRAMVSEIDRTLAVANRTADEIDVQLARATKLRHAILRSGFEGKLVPQNPTDEPASVLLDRIRTASVSASHVDQLAWSIGGDQPGALEQDR
jgi:type I restriction enzyme, S subunit